MARACHVTGQDGRDIARLLLSVDEVGSLHGAAGKTGNRLASGLLDGSLSPGTFTEFLEAFRQGGGHRKINNAVGQVLWAVSERLYAIPHEPTPAGKTARSREAALKSAITNIAVAAARLYVADLKDDAFELLRGCLKNDQVLTGDCVLIVTEKVRAAQDMADDARWRRTLTKTVGQWADGEHRRQAHAALRQPYPDENGWISG
jgi:hypothetical protein